MAPKKSGERKKYSLLPNSLQKGKYVPGYGASNARLAFVGEAPGVDDEREGIPFVGKAGQKQDALNEEAGIVRNECYWTNIYKYKLPYNKFVLADVIGLDYQQSVNELFKELRALPNLNVVVALGDNPLQALTGRKGIYKFRGSILPALYADFKVLPTIHPSHIVRQETPPWESDEGDDDSSGFQMKKYATPEIVICDLTKALKESKSKSSLAPKRAIEIVTDPFVLQKFFSSYSNSIKDWTIDIEISFGIPDMISFAPNPYHVAVVPLLSIIGKEGTLKLEPHIQAALYEVIAKFLCRKDIKLIGQNIKFDLDKIIAVSKLLGPFSYRDKVAADTALQASVLYPELPKKLEFLTSIHTNEPYYKDEGREYHPKKDSYDVKLKYCGKDSGVTSEIKGVQDKELKEIVRGNYLPHCKGDNFSLHDFYYSYVNRLTAFYMDMEREGLLVDKERHRELVLEYESKRIEIHQETADLIGTDFNVRSHTKDVPNIVFNILKLPRRANLRATTMVELLGDHTEPGSRESKVLRNILDERSIYTNENYLQAAWDADGYMRSSWNPGGPETGRSSTSNLKPPLRPFKDKPYKIGLSFHTLPKHGPWSKKIQSIFVAPEGYSYLERDYSQAEARIVAILSDDEETLRLFDTTDMHSLTASWAFGGDPKDITEDQRFIGKKGRHAGNYGMRERRLMLEINKEALKFGIPVQVSRKDAAHILHVFHSKTPKIRNVFQKEVRDICHTTRVLWNPFGRCRMFFGFLKDEECFAQLPQSTVPDHLRMAGLRLWDKYSWLRFLIEKHDSFTWLVKDEQLEESIKVTKEEMEVPIDFSKCSIPRGKLVIPTEAKVGKRLSEMEKVKE